MRVHIVLHDRELSHGASLQEVSQEHQGIPPGEVPPSAFGLHSHHRREEGERKKENSLVLFLKPTSHLCVFHLKSIYSEKSSLLSYPRYWTYPSAPIFLVHFIQKKDPQKQQAMYEERTEQNMIIWRERAESALKKTAIKYAKRCWKDWVEHAPHALPSVARAKRPFLRFFAWLRF